MALNGELYVAGPFDDAQVAALNAKFRGLLGTDVNFYVKRDERLIGGFLAIVDGKVYDASVSSRMKDMQHYLIGSE